MTTKKIYGPWIKWYGGECPVPPDTLVDIKLRSGFVRGLRPAGKFEHRAYVVSDPDCCDGYWLNYARPDGTMWTQATEHETPRAAIDAAKGGSNA